jgi:hypothetical protein
MVQAKYSFSNGPLVEWVDNGQPVPGHRRPRASRAIHEEHLLQRLTSMSEALG